MSAYAHLCHACGHLASRHGLTDDGDLVDGPYICLDCGCSITQDSPMTELNKREYEQWADQHPNEVWT